MDLYVTWQCEVFGSHRMKRCLTFVFVTLTPKSYANRPVTAVLDSLAKSKKAKHRQSCWERRADFTPFTVSTDGVIQRVGNHFLKRLASRLSEKWSEQYSETMNFVRTHAVLLSDSSCNEPFHSRSPKEVDASPHRGRGSNVTIFFPLY